MNKLFKTLAVVLCAFALAATLCSCGEEGTQPPEESLSEAESVAAPDSSPVPGENLAEIENVTFSDSSFVYDGTPKSLAVGGELPEGVTVAYENNRAVNAGKYEVVATLTGKGYKEKTLRAELTIEKAAVSGVSVSDGQSVKHDGKYHLPEITGTVPDGEPVEYFVDGKKIGGVTAIGKYEITVAIGGVNYERTEFTTEYRVKVDFAELAGAVISSFGKVPDPWQFLPSSFSPENRLYTGDEIDYGTDFVTVSSLPKNGMGKQLNMAYTALADVSIGLKYADKVYSAINAIETLYRNFLDKSPEEYTHFSANTDNFAFSIDIDGDKYLLSADAYSAQVDIYGCADGSGYGARVALSEGNVIRYDVTENRLKVAVSVAGAAAASIEFIRSDEYVLGYVYEYLVVADKQVVATSALIEVGEKYTTVVGNKGDFVPTSDGRNCEVYRNLDGAFIGSEVRETMKEKLGSALYDTVWFNLYEVNGIDTIKKEDKANGTNADTIYINGSEDTIYTTLYGGISAKSLSRRYDIEFKKYYFFTYDSEKEKYVSKTIEIPMFFVQKEHIGTLADDFDKKNKDSMNGKKISVTVRDECAAALDRGYGEVLPAYDAIKEAVTYESIREYLR